MSVKQELFSLWDKLEQWEQSVYDLPFRRALPIINATNGAMKLAIFPDGDGVDHSIAKEGWDLFRQVRAIQKANPAASDRAHHERHK